jgi:hypothetical protein
VCFLTLSLNLPKRVYKRTCLLLISTRFFYSSRLGSYNETQDLTYGRGAGKTLCSRALTALFVHTSYMPIMALMSDDLKMWARVLETYMTSCRGRSARLFFMLETCGSQRVTGHVTASEPTSTRRRGSESYDTWQRHSSPQPGGEVRSHRTRDNAGAHFSREVRSGAIEHVTAPESTLA